MGCYTRKEWKERVGAQAWEDMPKSTMLGLLRGLETARVFQQAMPEENRMQARIVLSADNISSVAAITSERPGSSQRTLQIFVEDATHLDENREAHIEVAWVPGHMGIAGNDSG